MEQGSGFVSFLKILGCILAISGGILNVFCLLSLNVGRKFGFHNLNSLLSMQTWIDLIVTVFYAFYTILFMRIGEELLCKFVNSAFPLWFFIYADVGMFVMLLADRYVAVTYPGVYRSFGIVLILRFGMSGVFIHAILQSIIHLVSVSLISDSSSACQEFDVRKIAQKNEIIGFVKADALAKLVGCSLLPITAIIFCCWQIVGVPREGLFGDTTSLSDMEKFLTQTIRGLIWRAVVQMIAIVIQTIPAAIGHFAESFASVSATSVGYQIGLFSLSVAAAIAPVITLATRPDCRSHLAKMIHIPSRWRNPQKFESHALNFLKNKYQNHPLPFQAPPPTENRSNLHSPADVSKSCDTDSRQSRSSTVVDRQTMTRRR